MFYESPLKSMLQFIPEEKEKIATVFYWLKVLEEKLLEDFKISEDVEFFFEDSFPKKLRKEIVSSKEVQGALRDGYNVALSVDSLDDVNFIFGDYIRFIEKYGLYINPENDPRPVIDCGRE